jgi:hypothetical protein
MDFVVRLTLSIFPVYPPVIVRPPIPTQWVPASAFTLSGFALSWCYGAFLFYAQAKEKFA